MIFSVDNLWTSPLQWFTLSTSQKRQLPAGHMQHCTPAALPVLTNTALSPSKSVAGARERLLRIEGVVGKIKAPQGAGWTASLKTAEDTLECALVCLCERVLVLGLRGRGYKSISRVDGVFSDDMSCLSSLRDKSRTELFQWHTTHSQAFCCMRQRPQSVHECTLSFHCGSLLKRWR